MELKYKHLIPYLEFGLRVELRDARGTFELDSMSFSSDRIFKYEAINNDISVYGFELYEITPILEPMERLTRQELYNQGFSSHIDYLTNEQKECPEKVPIEKAPYFMVQYLISKHYDVFGLIDKGLAKSKI